MIPGGQSVVIEIWTLFVVVILVFCARIASRRILFGDFRKFKIDDLLMCLVIVRLTVDKGLLGWSDIVVWQYVLWPLTDERKACFVVVIVAIYFQCLWGNNYVTPDEVVGWTPEDFHMAIEGSKWGVAMETNKVSCVWGCKACLLILYAQITKGLPNYHKAVKWVAAYVAAGYFVVMVCFFAVWCHPFHAYYNVIPVPDSSIQCMTYRNHMILDACLNITSDATMLCLPIPLMLKAKIPLGRKIALVGVFGLGGVVILCAILNRVTNFDSSFGSLVYLNWYAGETATAVIVANVPHFWPLINTVFRFRGGSTTASKSYPLSKRSPLRSLVGDGVGIPSASSRLGKNYNTKLYDSSSSEERIAPSGNGDDKDWLPPDKPSPDDSETMGEHRNARSTDLEANLDDSGGMTTTVRGGARGGIGFAHNDEELGGWEIQGKGVAHQKTGQQIVKTVHINQFASDH